MPTRKGPDRRSGSASLALFLTGYNPDGSLDLYIQRNSPGKGKEANWLPSAATDFSVTMRAYHPKPALLDGAWTPPAIEKLK